MSILLSLLLLRPDVHVIREELLVSLRVLLDFLLQLRVLLVEPLILRLVVVVVDPELPVLASYLLQISLQLLYFLVRIEQLLLKRLRRGPVRVDLLGVCTL